MATATMKRRLKDKRNNRGRIAAALRAAAQRGDIPALGFGQYFKLADAVCDSAVEASDADLDTFLDDAAGAGTGAGFDLFEAKVTAKVGGPLIDLITQLLPILLPLIVQCIPVAGAEPA